MIGFLLGRAKEGRGKLPFTLVIAAHYLSIPLLFSNEMFGDWGYLRKFMGYAPAWILAWLVIYLVGQVVLWSVFFLTGKLS